MSDNGYKIQTENSVKKRILHVDDDGDFLGISKNYLSTLINANFEIDTLVNPEEAVTKIKENKYDLIICDYLMPKINGLEILKELKSCNINIPFIIFTGRGREEVVVEAFTLGAAGYIVKGGDLKSQFTELYHKIMKIMDSWETKEALFASETKYRNLFETIPDAVFVADPITRKLIDCNQQAEKLIGKTYYEITDMNADDLHPDNLINRTMEAFNTHASGKSFIYESELITANNERIPVSISSSIVEANDGSYLLGIFRDISEQKSAENKLLRSRNLYQSIFEISTSAICIFGEDTIIKKANSQFEIISGFTKEELEGKISWTNHIPQSELQRLLELHKQRRIDPESVPKVYETKFINKQGTEVDILLTIDLIPGSKDSIISIEETTQ
ncbi:MAG: PAS domain S-box protein [Candidatus Heimdallarchaeaceae archaeon]